MGPIRNDPGFLIAVVLVWLYAAKRFNTPRTARSQTSRFQYYASLMAYVLSCWGLFMLVTWFLTTNPHAAAFLGLGSTSEPKEVLQFGAPLAAALFMTTLLPSLPVLRDIDARLLRLFHRMGSIPIGAVHWKEKMRAAEFRISPDLLGSIRKYVSDSPVMDDGMLAELRTDPAQDSARYRFTRNLALYVALTSLPARPRFADEYPEEIEAFEKTMASFFAQSAGFFALTRQLAVQNLSPAPDSIKNASDGYRSLCLEVHKEILLMLARMMLFSCKGHNEVARRLASLGFAIERPQQIRIAPNLLVLDGIGVIALFALATLFATGGTSIGRALIIGCLVAVTHSVAAVAAVVPKQLWDFADIRCSVERPVLAYVLSAVCALTICLPVSYAFWLLRQELGLPGLPFPTQAKWLLLSTVLAAALAFECDDCIARPEDPAWLRWVEGSALTGVMAFTGMVVVRWIAEDLARAPVGFQPRFWLPILLSASIGFLFGTTIPTWYRRHLRRSLAPTPPLVPVAARSPATG